jgi:hypothetical protein
MHGTMTRHGKRKVDADTSELIETMRAKLASHSDRSFEKSQRSRSEVVQRFVDGGGRLRDMALFFQPPPEISQQGGSDGDPRAERYWDPRTVWDYCDFHLFRPPFFDGTPQAPPPPTDEFDSWALALPDQGRLELMGVTWQDDPQRIGFAKRCTATLVTGFYPVPQGPATLRLGTRFHVQGSTTVLGGVPIVGPSGGWTYVAPELVVSLAAYSRLDDLKVKSVMPPLRTDPTTWGTQTVDKTVSVTLDIPVEAGDIVICMAQAELRLVFFAADGRLVGANFSSLTSLAQGPGGIEVTEMTAALDC